MKNHQPRHSLSQPEIDMREIEAWLYRLEHRQIAVNSAARQSFERLVEWAENNYRADGANAEPRPHQTAREGR